MKTLIYQGSVKNIYREDTTLEFEFTDQYSIFDWGVMPDTISDKGMHLARLATFFFEKLMSKHCYLELKKPQNLDEKEFSNITSSKTFKALQKHGAKTHFIKYQRPASLIVKPVKILEPELNQDTYNYDQYKQAVTDTLIPLEVVFRFGAPEGSSILKRNKDLQPNEMFSKIQIDFYTKLEPQDRYLTELEAKTISGLSDKEFESLILQTKTFAIVLENLFSCIDICLWDGKFEFAYGTKTDGNEREIILIDSIGPDELRLTKNSMVLSKEYLRSLYKKSDWYHELLEMKSLYPHNFKEKMTKTPKRLGQDELTTAINIYKDITDALIQKSLSIAIFGTGGREHALATHLSQSKNVKHVFVIPGNPGISKDKISTVNISEDEYVSFCIVNKINYTIIGPEVLLEKGISDQLENNNIPCASPSKKASILETSKAFSKTLMKKYDIPTASFDVFKDTLAAIDYVKTHNSTSFVVKLSGLAAGKGVILCHSKEEALNAVNTLCPNNEEIVIEEFLEGRELSFFALCLDDQYKVLGTACDYKRLKDGNQGPNTGGMGCYSPAYWLKEEDQNIIEETILNPTLKAMNSEGLTFKGMLFVGVMMTEQGPKVLEYNVRFGDPETQTLLPRLNTDLNDVLLSIATNNKAKLNECEINASNNFSVHIVKAAKGYPGVGGEMIEKGHVITNNLNNSFPSNKDSYLFYAGVAKNDQNFITSGGRILGLTAIAPTLVQARSSAYKLIESVNFKGQQFRTDIGL